MCEERALQNIEEAKVRNSIFKYLWEVRTNTLSARVYEFWKVTPWILNVEGSIDNLCLEERLEEHFGFELAKNHLEGRWQRARKFVGFKTEEELEAFKQILLKLNVAFK